MAERDGRFVAFEGGRRIAEGDWSAVSRAAWRALEAGPTEPVLVFDATGRVADLDPRDRAAAVETPEPAKRGRPKLGVVAREVTLLPRHWDWLAQQPGGASVALRLLVETARKDSAGADEKRAGRDAAYRFMQAMAGDLAGFEEASRALFADDLAGLAER
ncbi:MAG: hypothetical protein JWR59_1797, partial [Brevundimonas sp.]|nr:hypothetical protein [Brevundimonas sp.]